MMQYIGLYIYIAVCIASLFFVGYVGTKDPDRVKDTSVAIGLLVVLLWPVLLPVLLGILAAKKDK